MFVVTVCDVRLDDIGSLSFAISKRCIDILMFMMLEIQSMVICCGILISLQMVFKKDALKLDF